MTRVNNMYIRTKDGRIVDTENAYEPLQWAEQARDYALTEREANTIEELCDEFVVDWLPTNHKDIFKVDEYSKKIIEGCIGNNKTIVYGAIWTDKGLIYVAIMNENGELELI